MAENKNTNIQSDEISVKEIFLKINEFWRVIVSKKVIVIIAVLIGMILGFVNALLTKPIYKAELSFALQDEKGSGMSGALGIASQFGINLGSGSTDGEFSGDNLLTLMKSRSMVQKALLTAVNINNKQVTLADYYIDFSGFRKDWDDDLQVRNIHFLPNSDPSKFTLTQDSVLGILHRKIIEKNLSVDKLDKKLSIISLRVSSTNELFSKYFAEVLAKAVSDFYIQTKTKKAAKNVGILQRQTDSVKRVLNSSILGVASSIDANPNSNPQLQTLRVSSQRKTVEVQANTAILSELVKNLELAKMSLLQETPLIQVIDEPILPLEKEKTSKIKSTIVGGMLAMILAILFIGVNKFFKSIMSS